MITNRERTITSMITATTSAETAARAGDVTSSSADDSTVGLRVVTVAVENILFVEE